MSRLSPSKLLSRRKALRGSGAIVASTLAGCQTVQRWLSHSQPDEQWRYSFRGSLYDNPAVSATLVYVTAGKSVVGLDRETGTKEWETSVTEASIATAADTLFIWDHSGISTGLRALGVANHETRWQFDSINTMPRVRDGRAYVTESGVYNVDEDKYITKGGLHAVDLQIGTTHWTFEADGIEYPSVITDDVVFVWVINDEASERSDRTRGVYAVTIADGTERWRFEPPTPWAPMSLVDETLVVGSDNVKDGNARVYGVNPADGTEQWRFETPGVNAYPLHSTDERVFIHTWRDGDYTHVLDPATGNVKWRAMRASSRGVGDELVYLVRRDGTIFAADIGDGTERWTFDPTAHSSYADADWYPAVELRDDTLFVVNGTTLFGLDATTGDERGRFTADHSLEYYWTIHENDVYVATSERLYALAIL